MKTIRSLLFVAASAAALACGTSQETGTTTPPTTTAKVAVTIASVTLADDCGTGPTAIPPAQAPAAVPAPAEKLAAGDYESQQPGASMAKSMAMADRACEQSSIQLRVANPTDSASKVTVQKVELLDESGTMVAELTPRAPSRWAADSYQEWNEQVGASETLQVSYALSAPTVMRGATYTVRVVVGSAEGEQTLEQKTTLEAEASLPPGVVT